MLRAGRRADNKLQSLPQEHVAQLRALQTLDVRGNPMDSDGSTGAAQRAAAAGTQRR